MSVDNVCSDSEKNECEIEVGDKYVPASCDDSDERYDDLDLDAFDVDIVTDYESSARVASEDSVCNEFGPLLLVCPKNEEFGNTVSSENDALTYVETCTLTQKTTLVFFGASWCPPCRLFSPMLTDFYVERKQSGEDVEVVFVSLDNSIEDYESSLKDMPWLSVPYDYLNNCEFGRTNKLNLQRSFKVDGLPHLVVVSPRGKIRSFSGVENIENKPHDFPWYKSMNEIWPKFFIDGKGKLVDSELLHDKFVMLYFAASWSPPCQR